MLRILDLIFLKIMENHWYMRGEAIVYGLEEPRGRGCHNRKELALPSATERSSKKRRAVSKANKPSCST